MDQRTQFIADFLRQTLSVTELCDLYCVSRKTGHKWIDRYLRQGPAGLEERPRRPHESPNRTADEIVAALLEARRRHLVPAVIASTFLINDLNAMIRYTNPSSQRCYSGIPNLQLELELKQLAQVWVASRP